jgi:hypothetical protein
MRVTRCRGYDLPSKLGYSDSARPPVAHPLEYTSA